MTSSRSQTNSMDRRTFLGHSAVGLSLAASSITRCAAARADEQEPISEESPLRFGLNADPHLLGRRSPGNEAKFKQFVDQMQEFQPAFAIELGDFGCQVAEGQTTREMHDGQLSALRHHVGVFAELNCPRYHVMGNHDVGWLKGGDEKITPDDLIGRGHAGEDITKQEFLDVTGMSHRFYSFDVRGVHFIVLDGNNPPDVSARRGKDGVVGAYWIDTAQQEWLAEDLARHRSRPKIVFCHEELHHTPPEGSGAGGDVPFSPVGKETSYVDNGWQIRRLLAEDGGVVACFFGHKHRNRWTVYDKTHYITLAATHWNASFAAVTIGDHLTIQGFGGQRSYDLPWPTA